MCRVLVFIGPIIAFLVTKRICIGLQRQDEERVLHGYETGIIERTPDGAYSERHAPLSTEHTHELTAHNRPQIQDLPEEVDENGVRAPRSRVEAVRARLSRFFHGTTIQKPTREEIEAAHEHHSDHPELEQPGDDEFGGVSETGIPRRR